MTLAGPPEKMTACGAKLIQKLIGHILKRMNFAIHVQLAQAARDQLCHLAAESR